MYKSAYAYAKANFYKIVGRNYSGKKFLETPYDISFGLLKFGLFDMLDREMSVTPLN
jgi:hypothetical protein